MLEISDIVLQSSMGNMLLFLVIASCILLLMFIALGIPQHFLKKAELKKPTLQAVGQLDALPGNKPELSASMQPVTIMFIDLRDFHKLAYDKAPEEIANILNRFFDLAGSAAIGYGGWIDNYLGDGILVVFNNEKNPEHAAKKAIKAIGAIRTALFRLNKELSRKIQKPLQVGIGIHSGPALIANIGHNKSVSRRIVGPAVKIAYKLEELTKDKNVQVIMTVDAARAAELSLDNQDTEYVILRDHNIPVEVICFTAKQKIPRV